MQNKGRGAGKCGSKFRGEAVLKAMLIATAILTVFDCVCTAAGAASGQVVETNILLSDAVMSRPFVSCGLVGLFVCSILLWLWNVRGKAVWLPFAAGVLLLERAVIAVIHVVGMSAI